MGYSVSLVDGHIEVPKITDEDVIKALEWCEQFEENIVLSGKSGDKFTFALQTMQTAKQVLRDYVRQKAEISELQHKNSELEIELKSMRGAANSYKAKVEALTMDNEQLKSDLICEKMNFENVNELYKAEKEKLARARQKLIDAFKKGEK